MAIKVLFPHRYLLSSTILNLWREAPLSKRAALHVAWNRGRVETLNKAFGCRVCTSEDKPTNGEFIAMLADKLSLERSALTPYLIRA